MSFDRQTHTRLLSELDAHTAVRQIAFGSGILLLAAASHRGQSLWLKARKEFLSELRAACSSAGLKWPEFEAAANAYVSEVKRDWSRTRLLGERAPENSDRAQVKLSAMLADRRAPVLAALDAIPRSIPKAQNALAHVLGSELVNQEEFVCPDVLQVLASFDPRLVEDHRRRLRRYLLGEKPISTPRYWETEWHVAWLRHAERHELPYARRYIDEVCSDLENELRDRVSGLWSKSSLESPGPDLREALRLCWICSFSHQLRARVEQQVGNTLRVALSWQNPEGGWADFSQGGDGLCTETTAFAASCLQRFGDGAEWRVAAGRAVSCLEGHANPGGGWGNPRRMGGSGKLNIVATVAALDAMRVRGVPIEHHAIEAAEAALLNEQTPTGLWIDYRGYAEEYLTALVVGYFVSAR